MKTKSCPEADLLSRVLAGDLSDNELAGVEAHLLECEACVAELDRVNAEAQLKTSCDAEDSRPTVHNLDFLTQIKKALPGTLPTEPAPLTFGVPSPKGPLGRLGTYYHLVKQLGAGAFGVVYQAYDETLDQYVAIKVLRPERASAEDRVRFEREAQKAAAVKHDHVVTIHYVGQDPAPFIVMEYIDGEPLSDRLKRQGPLPAKEAARIVREVALGLAAAHERGQIHRDIKPANIMIERVSGRAKITDFGLARKTETSDTRLTQSGAIVGTPAYMSPEQITSPDELDGRSDVYSLGVVLYEILTGETPFRGVTYLDVLQQAVHDEPRPLRKLNISVPRDLETITLKCLVKQRSSRYASSGALAEDLQRFLLSEPIRARPASTLERIGKWARRRPAVAGLLTGLLAVFLISFALVAWQLRETDQALRREQATRKERVLAQINSLRTAKPEAVPNIVKDLALGGDEVVAQLLSLWRESDSTQAQDRIRLAIALIPHHPSEMRDELVFWLGSTRDPSEVILIRDALRPHKLELREAMWQRVRNARTKPEERFRSLIGLADFDPDNSEWTTWAQVLVDTAWTTELPHIGRWLEASRPVKPHLRGPLCRIFRATKSVEAASVLSHFAAEDGNLLAELLLDATAEQYHVLFPWASRFRSRLTERMEREFTLIDAMMKDGNARERERLARRKAVAAATLMKCGVLDKAWLLFCHTPDPEVRSQLLRHIGLLKVSPHLLLERLDIETDTSAKTALILALGEFSSADLVEIDKGPLTAKLLRWYQEEPDPGIHAAIDWLFRHIQEGESPRKMDWGQQEVLKQIDQQLVGASQIPFERRECARSWHVNKQGQTFACLWGPVEFQMGALLSDPDRQPNEVPHWRRINRSFAIASKPVTRAEFQRFLADRGVAKEHIADVNENPHDDEPMRGISLFAAMQYCNWLSEKDGLPKEEWCYPVHDEIKLSMMLSGSHVKRRGYRLPTEAEWEFAVRSGTTSSRFYGTSVELLPRYAWFLGQAEVVSPMPVGQKRPNDFGLFDAHGNVFNWTISPAIPYPLGKKETANHRTQILSDDPSDEVLAIVPVRVCRGAAYNIVPAIIRSAYRAEEQPPRPNRSVGLRPVRTRTLESFSS